MARIKYTDKTGEHIGTLTPAEYYIYSYTGEGEVDLAPTDRVPFFSWQNTDYEPFKRAVGKKYNTEVIKASII